MERKLQADPLLKVRNLEVAFPIKGGLFNRTVNQFKAVNQVSFDVYSGKTVGLVGESGSGKTSIGRAIAKLLPIHSGTIHYHNESIAELRGSALQRYRKQVQVIFQDPYGSLNPRMRIQQIIEEPLAIHFKQWGADRKQTRVAELLELVGLQPDHMRRYPHQFSGGQRQRIGIARALAFEPQFIICDEPVSALDVSVQAQIVNLLQDLQEQLNLTYLFIAHDLAVVEHISDHVLVMTQGEIVEQAPAELLYKEPQHAYTQKLLDAVPVL